MKTEIIGTIHAGLSPLWVLVLAMMALAIADIVRGDVKVAPKWAWIAVVVVFFPIGPLLYLLWGRVSRRAARGFDPKP
jgi:membrane protein implicated in regulation of membrane protease activity